MAHILSASWAESYFQFPLQALELQTVPKGLQRLETKTFLPKQGLGCFSPPGTQDHRTFRSPLELGFSETLSSSGAHHTGCFFGGFFVGVFFVFFFCISFVFFHNRGLLFLHLLAFSLFNNSLEPMRGAGPRKQQWPSSLNKQTTGYWLLWKVLWSKNRKLSSRETALRFLSVHATPDLVMLRE